MGIQAVEIKNVNRIRELVPKIIRQRNSYPVTSYIMLRKGVFNLTWNLGITQKVVCEKSKYVGKRCNKWRVCLGVLYWILHI